MEEQEKKKQEQLQLSNMLVKSIKKKASKVSMPEDNNKNDKPSNRLSSSDDEAIKHANSSIDKKDGEQSEQSSKVNVPQTEKKTTHSHQRNQLISPNRTSYNAECRSSKGDHPFNIKRAPSLEKKNSGMS